MKRVGYAAVAAVIALAVAGMPSRARACTQPAGTPGIDVDGLPYDWEDALPDGGPGNFCRWEASVDAGLDPDGGILTDGGPPAGDRVEGLSYTHDGAGTTYATVYLLIHLAGAPDTGATYTIDHPGNAASNGAKSVFTITCRTTTDCTTTVTVTGGGGGAAGSEAAACTADYDDVNFPTVVDDVTGDGYFIEMSGDNFPETGNPTYASCFDNTPYVLTVNKGGDVLDTVVLNGTSPNNFNGSTAVTLLSFVVRGAAQGADLEWQTGSEHGTMGFVVHRGSPHGEVVNRAPVPGHLESPFGAHYTLHDPLGTPGTAYYLEELARDGRRHYGPAKAPTEAQPSRRALELRETRVPQVGGIAPAIRGRLGPRDGFVRITTQGVYAVDASQLSALGLTNSVAISHDGVAWPFAQGAGGEVLFYASASNSAERSTDAYALVPGTPNLGRDEAVQAATAGFAAQFSTTAHNEGHTTIDLPAAPLERFPWGYVFSGTPTTFSFDAPGLQPGSTSITVRLIGLDDFNHDAQISVNGTSVSDTLFSGTGDQDATFTLPAGVLLAAGNVLTLNAQPDPTQGYDLVGLISIDATYLRSYQAVGNALEFTAAAGSAIEVTGFTAVPQVFDITSPSAPRLLTGQATTTNRSGTSIRFKVPSSGSARTLSTFYASVPQATVLNASLASEVPSGSAGYVAIVGDGLDATLAPLLSLRQSQGWSVLSVDVESLYDAFNHGEHGPEAIQAYLAQLSPAPTNVLLVGKPSIDPSNYLGTGTPDLVPATYVLSQDFSDLAIFDGAYVAGVDGLTPTAAIGRLPVQDAAELAPVVQKLVAYETSTQAPSGIALWVADDEDPDTGLPDPNFVNWSNTWAAYFPQLQALEVYMPTETSALLTALGGQPDLVSYHGHADGLDWTTTDLLSISDVISIPAGRPFFLVTVDCWDGMYAMPTFAPLSQALVEAPAGGAVAAFAASSLVDETRDPLINTAIYTALGDTTLATVGQVSLAAEQNLAAQVAPSNDLARIYNLIGDPASRLPLR